MAARLLTQVNDAKATGPYTFVFPNDESKRMNTGHVEQPLHRAHGPGSDAMSEETIWEKISTAPYDRDLELAVIEEDRVHRLVFACRRSPNGWIKVHSRERVLISPTHWRIWLRQD
jgi:hypothetical protein